MNYYPNYCNNQQQYYQPQQQYVVSPQYALAGKMVDSLDMVKATEVPVGGFGVFPKGDFSEVYIKTWNNNGTTNIVAYKPIPQQEQKSLDSDLNERVAALEKQIELLSKEKKKVISNEF